MLKFGLIFGFRVRYKFVFVSNACQVQVDVSVTYVLKFILMVTSQLVSYHLLSVQIYILVGFELKLEFVFALGSCFRLTYQIAICVRVKFALVLDASWSLDLCLVHDRVKLVLQ